ncbi:hypothetical protein ABI59_19020 [Acidobacteria bacterium Mor1]|nr:hypothetical protein ABI59_19020 [Acidobacteria bacterium Mor1]
MSEPAVAQSNIEPLIQKLDAEIRAGNLNFPVLPDVALRVRDMASGDQGGALDLAKIIEVEPALSARILKMANSPMFAGLSEIRSLHQAIGRLGTGMVVAVVVGSAGKDMFQSEDPRLKKVLKESWTRSVFASATATQIADLAGIEREQGFLGGLLYGCGQPILAECSERLTKEGSLPRPAQDPLMQAIYELSPKAGARLMSRWGLPTPLVHAIEHQRDLAACPEEHQMMCAVVGVSAVVGEGIAAADEEAVIAEAVTASQAGQALHLDEETLAMIIETATVNGRDISQLI